MPRGPLADALFDMVREAAPATDTPSSAPRCARRLEAPRAAHPRPARSPANTADALLERFFAAASRPSASAAPRPARRRTAACAGRRYRRPDRRVRRARPQPGRDPAAPSGIDARVERCTSLARLDLPRPARLRRRHHCRSPSSAEALDSGEPDVPPDRSWFGGGSSQALSAVPDAACRPVRSTGCHAGGSRGGLVAYFRLDESWPAGRARWRRPRASSREPTDRGCAAIALIALRCTGQRRLIALRDRRRCGYVAAESHARLA